MWIRCARAAAVLIALAGGADVAVAASPRAGPGLETYGALPAAAHMALSASGGRVAFISSDGVNQRLVVRATGDGAERLRLDLGDAKVREVWWTGDDFVQLQVSNAVPEGGGEVASVLVVSATSAANFYVFDHRPRMVLPAVLGVHGDRRIDGRWYGFYSGFDVAGRAQAVFRVDLESGETRPAAAADPHLIARLLGPDGRVAVREFYGRDGTDVTSIAAGANGRDVTFRKADPFGEISLLGFGRTADTVAVLDRSGEDDLLEEVSLTGSGAPTILARGRSLAGPIYDPGDRLLVGVRTTDRSGARLLDPVRQAKFEAARANLPGLQAELIDASAGFERAIVFTSGGEDSGTYWLLDLQSGAAKRLAEAYPDVGSQVAATRMFAYRAADGLELEGVLTLPPGRKAENLPVVVLPHGGPIDVFDGLGFNWWAQAFAVRGYAVFQPNFRGSGGYGAEFRKAGLGEFGGKIQSDIDAGLAALAATGVVDSRRACIVGASYGGYSALAGVTLRRGVYRCAAAYGGVADVRDALWTMGDDRGRGGLGVRLVRRMTGVGRSDARLKEISPAYHPDAVSAPLLLMHGVDDSIVPIGQTRDFSQRLRAAGIKHDYLELRGEDHWLSQGAGRMRMLGAVVAFVEANNPQDD